MIWQLFRRALLPVLVLALGIGALVYGVRGYTVPVFVEQEIEITLEPPPSFPPELPPGSMGPHEFGGMSGFPGDPGNMPPFNGPPPELQKITQTVVVSHDEPEMAIVRDVTIGGLALLDSGDLRRTYTGQPPSLCPT